jgi:hypothetical protein
MTHMPIADSGQGITNQHLLAPKLEKAEKLFEICVQNILLQICAEAIIWPLGCHRTS